MPDGETPQGFADWREHSDAAPAADATDDVAADGGKTDVLAELREEQKTQVQLEEVRARTVEPGLMRLPVTRVATAEDSGKVTIDVEHPIEGEARFHLTKPRTWDPENELVQFLDMYGLHIGDIYHLQTRTVYVDVSAEKPRDWVLVQPPGAEPTPSRTERAVGALGSASGAAWAALSGVKLSDWAIVAIHSALSMALLTFAVANSLTWFGLWGSVLGAAALYAIQAAAVFVLVGVFARDV